MKNLTPVKLVDKNGHLVTRYVKNGQSPAAAAGTSLPAPQLTSVESPADFTGVSSLDYKRAVADRFRELGDTGSMIGVEDVLHQLRHSSHQFNGAAERLYSMLPELDWNGVKTLTNGVPHVSYPSSAPHQIVSLFATSVLAYDYARGVDNSIVTGTREEVCQPHTLMSRAVDFFGREGRLRVTDEIVGDLESRYLLDTLGLKPQYFNSRGDYYRALTKLKGMQDDLQPYLPLMIAMHTAYERGKRDYYFEDDWYLWENIESVMQFPVERIEAIARETVRRGEFDEGLAQEVASSSGSDILNDGLL